MHKTIVSALLNPLLGYSLDLKLSANELATIQHLIKAQWLDVIDSHAPHLAHQFEKFGIESYHLFSDQLAHSDIWPKSSRILPQTSVNKIRELTFMKLLNEIFGDYRISSEENIRDEEIYWRLVRPNKIDDIGPMHADAWFWNLGHGITPKQSRRVKIWIPIYCEPGLNGLNIVPASHAREWQYTAEMRNGFIKPQFDQSQVDLPILLPKTNPGEAIIFNDKLLHKGAYNAGKKTRVSIEFTLFVDQKYFNIL